METNLAYIDDVVNHAVTTRSNAAGVVSDADRSAARAKAVRPIAGFRVHDEEAERRVLDEMISKRRAGLDAFIADRAAVRERLSGLGIAPMAVLPVKAWDAICDRTQLFRFEPDGLGRVGISRSAWERYPAPDKGRRTWEGLRRSEMVDALDHVADSVPSWRDFLLSLWPSYRGLLSTASNSFSAAPQTVTVLLPPPPADVADTLLRAAKGNVKMKVAAVAEAIGFKEDLKALRDGAAKHYEDEERRIEQLRNEPFIYTENGTAAAILAQFGDFPIEKEIVDLVVASDDLIPEKPTAVDYMQGEDVLNRQYAALMGTGRLNAIIGSGGGGFVSF